MNKVIRVALYLSKLSDEALEVKVQTIIKNMTNNASFPAPIVELDALQAALTAFQAALVAQRATPVKESTSRKNDMRAALEQAYRILGNFVESKSNNDRTILLSTGFEVRKSSAPTGRLEKPTDLQVIVTNKPGTVKVSVSKVAGATGYLFQYAPSPVTDEGQWKTISSTSRTKMIDGLESGKAYAFRVTAIGADPTIAYSDTVTRFVS
ncbi:fibronectin type III domain-containing protein [Chryseolinea soli]|uniref:Fibronectin type-III domain-containing protein n=1 Tax=Chryseolinea soli TaxID=2321403 RepID=A0A385SNC3_9BACT|nr:fibronectin type III domain-containing protein [Chryseolinea soli]AYB32342.1 hypothetical protein D4L85_17965 [Chryseolinea soli]